MHRKEIEAAVEHRAQRDLRRRLLARHGPRAAVGTWERRRADSSRRPRTGSGPRTSSADDALDHAVRSYLRGFGPAARRDIADYLGSGRASSTRRSGGSSCAASATRAARSCSTCRARRCPTPRHRRRPLPADLGRDAARARAPDGSCPSSTARASSARRRRSRSRRSSSTAPLPGTWREEKGRIKLSPFGRLDKSDAARARRGGGAPGRLHAG